MISGGDLFPQFDPKAACVGSLIYIYKPTTTSADSGLVHALSTLPQCEPDTVDALAPMPWCHDSSLLTIIQDSMVVKLLECRPSIAHSAAVKSAVERWEEKVHEHVVYSQFDENHSPYVLHVHGMTLCDVSFDKLDLTRRVSQRQTLGIKDIVTQVAMSTSSSRIMSSLTSHSRRAQIPTAVPCRVIVMERCVCTLDDMLKMHASFDHQHQFQFVKDRADLLPFPLFDWQTLCHAYGNDALRQQANERVSTNTQRDSFHILARAACQRASADLCSSTQCKKHFVQLLHCVRYIHEQAVVHMDLKPRNIFARVMSASAASVHSFKLVLGDFDLGCVAPSPSAKCKWSRYKHHGHGTEGFYFGYYYSKSRNYTQFEREHPPSPEFDIFSLGIVFLCMLHGSTLSTMHHWVRLQTRKCKRHGDARCTPAHVLLAIDGSHDTPCTEEELGGHAAKTSSMIDAVLRNAVRVRNATPEAVKRCLVQMTGERPISVQECLDLLCI